MSGTVRPGQQIGRCGRYVKAFRGKQHPDQHAQKMDAAALEGKIIVGDFIDREKAELSEQWHQLHGEMTEDR